MAQGRLSILQVNTSDIGGGAENLSRALHRTYQAEGHDARLAVGRRRTQIENVEEIPNDARRSWLARQFLRSGDQLGRSAKLGSIRSRLGKIVSLAFGQPRRLFSIAMGNEDFEFPGCATLLDAAPNTIIHLHNLHGGYFDLRILPELSSRFPVVITMHDGWLLAGHCAHSFECERWKTGCGRCPQLPGFPRILRDSTADNFKVKQAIYRQSRYYVCAPSHWLIRKAQESILADGAAEFRVIPNGVDLSVFKPGNRDSARQRLGIPADCMTALFVANHLKTNPYKDHELLRQAIARLATQQRPNRLIVMALGDEGPAEQRESAEIRYFPTETLPERVADYYRAADVYVHPAKADTFPTTVLEALACGTPVVATAVGGIVEQVSPLVNGLLTEPGDAGGFATAIESLLTNDHLRRKLADAAAANARQRFDIRETVQRYLDWFQEIRAERDCSAHSAIRRRNAG